MMTVEKKRMTHQKRTSGTYGPLGPQALPTNSPRFSIQSCNTKQRAIIYTERVISNKAAGADSRFAHAQNLKFFCYYSDLHV